MATQPVAESAIGKRLTPRRIGIDTLWDYAVLLTFVVLFVALSIASPAFLTTRNLFNILDQSAPVGIIACAATLVIIAGGFDLSAGAIFALAGVIAAKTANATDPATGMLVALLVATALGLFNGLLVSGFQINPFVATLATGMMIRLGGRDHERLSRHGSGRALHDHRPGSGSGR
jgi:ribose transport system permease protein